jgi:hydrogenase maturation factor
MLAGVNCQLLGQNNPGLASDAWRVVNSGSLVHSVEQMMVQAWLEEVGSFLQQLVQRMIGDLPDD